ncbi:MAG: phosphotransferase family protein [Dehalococcoidia bacterium]
MDPRDEPNLDPRAILDSLGFRGPAAIVPVSGGTDTTIWRVRQANTSYALRVFRAEQAATCAKEVTVMRAARAGGVPVPAVQAVGSWHDYPALLLSWCPGRTFVQALQKQPWTIWRLGVLAGRTQARIHAVAAPPALQQASPSWFAWAGPAEQALRSRLQTLSLRPAALLHLDYHPLNIMTDGRRITGVLDWANAGAGEPRADLARTIAILRLAPLGRFSTSPPVEVLRRLLVLSWQTGYQQSAGPVGDLTLFYAWAGATTARDLTGKVAPATIARIHRWTALQKRKAGVAG